MIAGFCSIPAAGSSGDLTLKQPIQFGFFKNISGLLPSSSSNSPQNFEPALLSRPRPLQPFNQEAAIHATCSIGDFGPPSDVFDSAPVSYPAARLHPEIAFRDICARQSIRCFGFLQPCSAPQLWHRLNVSSRCLGIVSSCLRRRSGTRPMFRRWQSFKGG